MIKKILIAIALLLVVFLAAAAMQANDYRVERKATLSSTPAALFEHVSDQHHFAIWNPWLKLDPQVKLEYAGASSGVGAVCQWQGNGEVGAGKSTLRESKANEMIRFQHDWSAPMAGTNTVEFTFTPDGDKTLVTLSMFGPRNFMMKVMSLVMNCDKMFGPKLEQGLADLGNATSRSPN